MLLALRKDPPKGATLWQRFACWIIKVRLVSHFCHGGIVIDGCLYHSTSARGLHVLKPGEWNPDNWHLIEVSADRDAAWRMWVRHAGAAYDWLSLLAFVGFRVRDSSRLYCFEWCWAAMTGVVPSFRVTPEMLIMAALEKK
ncbi:MAG: Permuted papain-like amidase enzyme YaeF/YiiX, family [Pseudomonadota bacterium]|jgi:hypothetical protein